MVSPFEGKTELFQKKVIKKGPKTGSVGITLQKVKSKFFRHFQGFLKIQVEMTRAGKGGEAGADKWVQMSSTKITKICHGHGQTHTSLLKPWVAEKEAPSAQ